MWRPFHIHANPATAPSTPVCFVADVCDGIENTGPQPEHITGEIGIFPGVLRNLNDVISALAVLDSE